MARPLRILFEGAYYHVINRGQGKRNIFLDKADYKTFLRILKETCQLYEVSIVSYCLMSNHYHLLIHTPKGNLPDFMRQLNGVYTQVFNRRYKSDGPLFKGRYKDMVVQDGSYLLRIIRYSHRNPIKAGIVKKDSDYIYSSHNDFIRQEENEWLKFLYLLKTQFKGQKNLKKAYADFMKKDDQELEDFLNNKSRQGIQAIIFGNEAYIDEVKMNYLHGKRLSREIPQEKQIHEDLIIKKIKKAVIKAFNIGERNLYSSIRGKNNIARMVAIGLARECGGISYEKIAQIFGGINYKSAAKYYERVKQRCESDGKFRKLFNDLKQRCSQVET